MLTCADIEKKIPEFFDNTLSGKQTLQFMEHIENCSECKEEVTIYYLATEGVTRLENGTAFDLDEELKDALHKRKKKGKISVILRRLLYMGAFLAILVVAWMVFYIFM